MPDTSTPFSEPIFISALEAARLLGVSRAEVYALMDRGQIAHRYHGRRRLAVAESVHAFARSLPAEKAV